MMKSRKLKPILFEWEVILHPQQKWNRLRDRLKFNWICQDNWLPLLSDEKTYNNINHASFNRFRDLFLLSKLIFFEALQLVTFLKPRMKDDPF